MKSNEALPAYTCPRCDTSNAIQIYEGRYECECGLYYTHHSSYIRLGKYTVNFVADHSLLLWDEPIRGKYLDQAASVKKMDELFGENWYLDPVIRAQSHKHRVYVDDVFPNPQTITLPSLRWKIELSDIEKLMVLR